MFRSNPMFTPLVPVSSAQARQVTSSYRGNYSPAVASGQHVFSPQGAGFGQHVVHASSSSSVLPTSGVPEVIGFASQSFYCQESSSFAEILVLRFGGLQGSCSCHYRTQAGSALPGIKYEDTEGQLLFRPGEHTKRICVPIIDDDVFDTTIHFTMILEDPSGCVLSQEFLTCSVNILDNDVFPSNTLKTALEAATDEALHKVGFTLLWSFIRFCFQHVPSIRWKTILSLVLGLLDNLYYLGMYFLKVYLVNSCLAIDKPSTADNLPLFISQIPQLSVTNQRKWTTTLLAALLIFPNFILTGADYFEMKVLEVPFNIRKFLRVNLFRKYLSYTDESRRAVPIQDLKTSMMDDIPDVVAKGYMTIFRFGTTMMRILVVGWILSAETTRAIVPLFVYPATMLVFLWARYSTRLQLLMKQGEGESVTVGWLLHADNAHRLITDFQQRGFVVHKFEEVLNNQRRLTMNLKQFTFWNDQICPWITTCVSGLYLAWGGCQVIDGKLSLGVFLAVFGAYRDLGDRYVNLYECFQTWCEVIEPLTGITLQFNLATDVDRNMQCHKERDNYMQACVERNPKAVGYVSAYDAIPITFDKVTIEYSPTLKSPGVSVECPQGVVVMIRGPHETGKSTLLNLLSNLQQADVGQVNCPLHLRTLNVSSSPVFVSRIGMTANLTFGLPPEVVDKHRLQRLLARVGLDKPWVLAELHKEQRHRRWKDSDNEDLEDDMKSSDKEELNSDEEGEEDADDEEGDMWVARLSDSEKKRFHLLRAFVFNPEVLYLHRPVVDMDLNICDTVLTMMREFVDLKGVEVDPGTASVRRPRTLFFTHGTTTTVSVADIVWQVGLKDGIIVEKGHRPPTSARTP